MGGEPERIRRAVDLALRLRLRGAARVSEQIAKGIRVHFGDCLAVLPALAECSIDSCVTDPPYHLTSIVKRFGNEAKSYLSVAAHKDQTKIKAAQYRRLSTGFMGKQWDGGDIAFRPETWREVHRVLKPGAHLLAFGGTRTYHRMACAIEDAGFEIRDTIMWIYGSGFPKSHDVSKGIARRAGGALVARQAIEFMRARREEIGLSRIEFEKRIFGRSDGNVRNWEDAISLPNPGLWPRIRAAMELQETPFDAAMERGDIELARFDGDFGYQSNGNRWNEERIIREPATDAARQWQGWGTALKPACEPIVLARKPLSEKTVAANVLRWGTGAINVDKCRVEYIDGNDFENAKGGDSGSSNRSMDGWGLNERIPQSAKIKSSGRWPANIIHDGSAEVVAGFPQTKSGNWNGEEGSAARFFYTSKADTDDRLGSRHPTVKPVDLIQYLVRLVTPKGGTCIDPFAGTGTTGEAAAYEGAQAILIEREYEYLADMQQRMRLVMCGPDERRFTAAKARQRDKPVDAGPLFGGVT